MYRIGYFLFQDEEKYIAFDLVNTLSSYDYTSKFLREYQPRVFVNTCYSTTIPFPYLKRFIHKLKQ